MKSTIILPLLFIFNSLHTLQVDKCLCYLTQVPKDVQDLIALYLTFKDRETDKELVERALEDSNEVSKLPLAISFGPFFQTSRNLGKRCNGTACYLHDRSKILVIDEYYSNNDPLSRATKVEVALVDLKQQFVRPSVELTELCNKKTDWQRIEGIVLSKDGMLVARKIVISHPRMPEEKTEITVKDIKTGTEKSIVNEWDISIAWYEFNKQGTKILILSREIHQNTVRLKDTLYSLTPEKEHIDKSKKTLSAYFRQNLVCKDLAHSLNV